MPFTSKHVLFGVAVFFTTLIVGLLLAGAFAA
jgi:hypothetical protein